MFVRIISKENTLSIVVTEQILEIQDQQLLVVYETKFVFTEYYVSGCITIYTLIRQTTEISLLQSKMVL